MKRKSDRGHCPILIQLVFAFLLLAQAIICQGQPASDSRVFHDGDFRWSMTIPTGFERMPDSGGLKAIGRAVTILAFKSDQYDNFAAYSEEFTDSEHRDYQQMYSNLCVKSYEAMKARLPANSRLDSSYGRETVGGKEFNLFRMSVTVNPQTVLHLLWYSRLFGKKELKAYFMFEDEVKGNAMLKAWRDSSFDK